MIKRFSFCLLFLIIFRPFFSFADSGPLKKELRWSDVSRFSISDDRQMYFLSFEGCVYEEATADLPVYRDRFAIGGMNSRVEAVLTEQLWEDLPSDEIERIAGYGLIGPAPRIVTDIAIERKEPYATVSFVPLRRDPASGRYQKLLSFTLNIKVTPVGAPSTAAGRTYRQNSVLATGNWYKMAVKFSGIHKITYNDLIALGMNPAGIDPGNIRIYGNGGGMLPEPCGAFRYDDLMENAIFVSGQGDGSFDTQDYILFYGESPHVWEWDEGRQAFVHTSNIYSDYNYYFITADLGTGKRIQGQASVTLPLTHLVNSFTDRKFIEKDDLNIVKTGRDWFESPPYEVQLSNDYDFSFPDIVPGSNVGMRSRVAARSSMGSNFKYYLNGTQLIETLPVSAVSFSSDQYAHTAGIESTFEVGSPNVRIKVTYSKPASASVGWMDYIALNARRYLRFTGGQMAFRDPQSGGPGNVAEYELSNASASVEVWNVSDPMNVARVGTSLDGSLMRFRIPADSIEEFVAFDGTSFYGVAAAGKVDNQNLHAITMPDMVIVSYPSFLSEANRLANHHRNFDGMEVFVTTPQKIYNEFSSGAQDVTAIRDFIKMLYDKASPGSECRYLLLFGDASYDYKDRVSDNTNFVPTWQDKRSMNIITSIATDDYFGFLDDNEGGSGTNQLLDLGIGRLVASTPESARQMVDKVIHYATATPDVFGNWRNVVCFVADDEDANVHMQQHAEKLATRLDTTYGYLNVDKIYLDAYEQISTSGGQRAPQVNQAINNRMEKGSLIMNYTGHGGEVGWAHERILELKDINSWTNYNKLPVFITATCEFSRYDDPTRTSAGELVLLNPDGGAIALFTTARATYGSPNFQLNNAMFDNMFEKVDGEYPRFGDLIRYAKNKSGNSTDNDKKFVLLGNPALRLAYPEHRVRTIQINNVNVSPLNDTLRALQKVSVSGIILDEAGNKLNSYNGTLRPVVYDKPTQIETLVTDPASKPFTFGLRMAILYNGKASITNGEFSFTFIVPKDIIYKYGYGKISYYLNNNDSDGTGYYGNVIIGGFDSNVPPDDEGPEIDLYMNDENFAFGGITDENPVLLAFVTDSSGINTVGSGIGHDIVATLDNDNNKSVIINEYYESDIDSYTSGTIRYPLAGLSEGPHSMKLKVWDVHNNSSESYTEFVVASSAELAIDHVLNYPNPFTTSTAFYFDHNQPNTMLEVQVQVFSVSGRLIKTIDQFVISNGYRSEPIYWDGRDDFGDRIGRGVYIYKVRVRNQDGSFAEKLEKLVILR
jgi:hypothetical protein